MGITKIQLVATVGPRDVVSMHASLVSDLVFTTTLCPVIKICSRFPISAEPI
jgi:hypothetical protein